MPKRNSISLNSKDLFWEKIKQNYQSLILGFLVFLVGLSVVYKLIKSPQQSDSTSKTITTKQEKQSTQIKKHQIKEGETLWSIAENYYGSGFNIVDLAKANKINNPDLIETGQELIIPSVKPEYPTTGLIAEAKTEKVTITGSKYTIQEGDHLWKIAFEAYGDGYQWLKLAKTNNINNPDLIYAGNVLTIPR
jgi:putative chitinase